MCDNAAHIPKQLVITGGITGGLYEGERHYVCINILSTNSVDKPSYFITKILVVPQNV